MRGFQHRSRDYSEKYARAREATNPPQVTEPITYRKIICGCGGDHSAPGQPLSASEAPALNPLTRELSWPARSVATGLDSHSYLWSQNLQIAALAHPRV